MTKIRLALLICSNTVGGHEFQAAALGCSLAERVAVTVFVNRTAHAGLFQQSGLEVRTAECLLLQTGYLPMQFLHGYRRRKSIRALVQDFDYVIVSAGAVEASVAVGVALKGYKPTSMYLPSFYDRVPEWGFKGHIYNCILAKTCKIYNQIITINKIQAKVIGERTAVDTVIVSNKIRQVSLPLERGPPRLIFIGRMDKQKRVDQLIQWLDVAPNPIKQLILIGEGPMRPNLETLARELTHLNCTFLGWTGAEEQDHILRSSDVLVLNSLIEGEPLVVREARLRGMHVLAREITGTRGITSRQERFRTQGELLDRLETIFHHAKVGGNGKATAKPKSTEFQRTKMISLLIQSMVRACSAANR